MKLERLRVQNFRAIPDLTLDFTDELGRVRDLVLIVGPNGSGKTSILDAIWFGLKEQIGYRLLRSSFRTEPRYVVMTGARYARADYTLSISKEERQLINEWKDELVQAGAIGHHPGPDQLQAQLEWTYPAQPGYEEKLFGGYRYPNRHDWAVLRGKEYARRLRKISAVPVRGAEQAGGVYFFEQERRIVAEPVRAVPVGGEDEEDHPDSPVEMPRDIRSALIDFGVREQLGHIPQERSWYRLIRESYEYICAPHRMGEVYTDQPDGEYEIDFTDGTGRHYSFDGLSSGERAVLNMLVQYFAKKMRNSIVLIDELELHLHPTWQRRLLQNFLQLGDGNQYIITTHAPSVRQVVPLESTIELGALEDIPAWQTIEDSEESA